MSILHRQLPPSEDSKATVLGTTNKEKYGTDFPLKYYCTCESKSIQTGAEKTLSVGLNTALTKGGSNSLAV
jgi:hypothetical protein